VAEATSVEKVVPFVEPRTDSVWVLVCHAVDGGRSIVMEPRVWTDPRFTVMVLGQTPLFASQYVLVFPSTVLAGTYVWVELDAVTEAPSARSVVELVPVPDSATVSGLPGALLLTDSVPVADPAAVGANVTLTVQEPPAAMELPQVLVWLNGPLTLTEDTDAAVLPGLDTVTVCAALVDPVAWLPNDTLDGDADRGLPPPDPLPGKTSNSDSCAADQPVLAVKLSSTYRALVPDGSGIVTVLPAAGLKVYPADPTIWLNVVLLVLP
jgi:hypothetical protein